MSLVEKQSHSPFASHSACDSPKATERRSHPPTQNASQASSMRTNVLRTPHTVIGRSAVRAPRATRSVVHAILRSLAIDDEVFQSLLEQVQELHRRTDEITRSKTRVHENIRARLHWNAAPPLPSRERELADEVVNALDTPRLSTTQSRRLWRAYFGK